MRYIQYNMFIFLPIQQEILNLNLKHLLNVHGWSQLSSKLSPVYLYINASNDKIEIDKTPNKLQQDITVNLIYTFISWFIYFVPW